MLELPRNTIHQGIDYLQLRSPIFVIGAAHSGKSGLAQQLLDEDNEAIVIGTGQVTDENFSKRIQELKDQRPKLWQSHECTENLIDSLESAAETHTQIIIDSINQWIANLTLSLAEKYDIQQLEELITHQGRQLCSAIKTYSESHRIVLVSSEVGAGISPPSALARIYRQSTSRLNCHLAENSKTVMMISAGLPMILKGS